MQMSYGAQQHSPLWLPEPNVLGVHPVWAVCILLFWQGQLLWACWQAGLVSSLIDCEAMPPEVAVGQLGGRVGFLCVWLCDPGWRGTAASLLVSEAGFLHGFLCSWGAWDRCWPAGVWGLDPGANRLEGRFQNGALLEPVLSWQNELLKMAVATTSFPEGSSSCFLYLQVAL